MGHVKEEDGKGIWVGTGKPFKVEGRGDGRSSGALERGTSETGEQGRQTGGREHGRGTGRRWGGCECRRRFLFRPRIGLTAKTIKNATQ